MWDIQRHAKAFLSETFSPTVELDSWIKCNFSEAHSVIKAASYCRSNNLKFHGIVHATAHHDPVDPLLISQHELNQSFDVNIFGPLCLTSYLHISGCFVEGARVIFLLDQRTSSLGRDHLAYTTAKNATMAIVETYRSYLFGLEFLYVAMPSRGSENVDQAETQVVKILTDEELPLKTSIII